MNDTTHTPGPWSIDRSEHFQTFQIVGPMFGNGGFAVAEMAYAGPQSKANARLIASAPKLLAALEQAADGWQLMAHNLRLAGGGISRDLAGVADAMEIDARAAIAKAKGL